jgi:hypothetical protein
MLATPHPFLRRLAKPLAIALGVLSLLFLLQVSTHSHAKGQDESACRLCQMAHSVMTPAVSALQLSVPLVSCGQVTAIVTVHVSESCSEQSPSRAPPSL